MSIIPFHALIASLPKICRFPEGIILHGFVLFHEQTMTFSAQG